MSKNAIVQTLLELANDKSTITVHRSLVDFTGTLEAGMMLSQLLYWTPRTSVPDGWIAKSDDEFHTELCLTKYAVRSARALLESMGIIELKLRKFQGTPMIHYRVQLDLLSGLWQTYIMDKDNFSTLRNQKVDFAKSKSPTLRNQKVHLPDSQSLNTESITEIIIECTAPDKKSNTMDSTDLDEPVAIMESEKELPPGGNLAPQVGELAKNKKGDALDGMIFYAQNPPLSERVTQFLRKRFKIILKLDGRRRNTDREFMEWCIKQGDEIMPRLERFGNWWYAKDWRGKKGDNPTPYLIETLWANIDDDSQTNQPQFETFSANAV